MFRYYVEDSGAKIMLATSDFVETVQPLDCKVLMFVFKKQKKTGNSSIETVKLEKRLIEIVRPRIFV